MSTITHPTPSCSSSSSSSSSILPTRSTEQLLQLAYKECLSSIILGNSFLTGVPACLTYSYLGNVQIVQMVINQERVEKIISDLDLVTPSLLKETLLLVLSFKLEQVAHQSLFPVVIFDQGGQRVDRLQTAQELLQLKSRPLEIDFSETFINNDQLSEISKIMFLAGVKNIGAFLLKRCANIKEG